MSQTVSRILWAVVGILLLVAGVIFPVQAVNEGFCDKLEELASMTRRELDKHLAAPPVTEEEDEGQENVFGGGDGET